MSPSNTAKRRFPSRRTPFFPTYAIGAACAILSVVGIVTFRSLSPVGSTVMIEPMKMGPTISGPTTSSPASSQPLPPSFIVTQTGPSAVLAGGRVMYQFTVTNTSAGVVVANFTDDLPFSLQEPDPVSGCTFADGR